MSDRGRAVPRWWLPIVCTSLVWGVAILVAGDVRRSLVDLRSPEDLRRDVLVEIPAIDRAAPPTAETFADDQSRLLVWGALELLLITGLVFGIAVCIWLGRSRWERVEPSVRRKWFASTVALSTAVLIVLGVVYSKDRDGTRGSLIFVFDRLSEEVSAIQTCARVPGMGNSGWVDCLHRYQRSRSDSAVTFDFDSGSAKRITSRLTHISNPLTVLFILSFVATSSLLLGGRIDQGREISQLAQLSLDLRELLYLGALLLVVGVGEIYVQFSWLAVYLSEGSATQVVGLVRSMAALFGVFFSLVLVATYVPASISITRIARAEALRELGGEETRPASDEVRKWLGQRGFDEGIAAHLGRIAAIVSPIVAAFLSGPAAQLIASQ